MVIDSRIDYLDKDEFYTKLKPDYSDYDERLPQYWDMIYADRAKQLKSYLKDRRDILDVGCGSGRAMKRFSKHGFACFGVEPSSSAIERSDELKNSIFRGLWPTVEIGGHKFNVVYFEQVLSHMPDVGAALRAAHKVLMHDGIILIEEPNDLNPLQRKVVEGGLAKGGYWNTPDHLHYGSFGFWCEELRRARFRIVDVQATWPMEWFALAGENYFGNDELGKKCHEKRFKMLNALSYGQRQTISRAFAEAGIGRDVVVYAQKL